MNKDRVAEILVDIGALLELKGENPFKTRAYASAARAIESLKRTPGENCCRGQGRRNQGRR